uniref:Tr-type G domain-containing protein n=1 Tax=Anopheles maculatus TaxID=74869 RepID=A0A182SXN7_9DIPT
MGKAKKGKKDTAGAGGEGNVSDNDVPQTDITEVEVENRKNDKKSKKEKRAKKLAVDSDDDEDDEVTKVTESVKKLAVTKKKDKQPSTETEPTTGNGSDNEKQDGNVGKNKDVKKKKAAKSGPVGFSLLMMDNDDDDDEDEEPEEQDKEMSRKSSIEEEVAPKEGGKGKKVTQSKKDSGTKMEEDDSVLKGGKKSKKKKKKDEEDDDEIDRMLAELGMEYSGQKPPPSAEETPTAKDSQPAEKQSKKKDKKKKKDETNVEEAGDDQTEVPVPEVKTAPEKKKGKLNIPAKEEPVVEPPEPAGNDEPKKKGKNKGKKNDASTTIPDNEGAAAPKKGDSSSKGEPAKKVDVADTQSAEASAESKKKKPNKAALAIMQERLKAIREEEERLRKEEEEKQQLEEQAEQFRLEQLRLEQEKKEKKKQKEKERKERLKAEGKLLTAKQKQNRARAQAMLEALKAQGVGIPESTGERRAKPGSRIRPKKNQDANKEVPESKESTPTADEVKAKEEKKVKEKEVKESWDATDSEEDEEDEVEEEEVTLSGGKSGVKLSQQQSLESKASRGSFDDDDNDDEDDEDDDDSGDDDDDNDGSDDGDSSGSEVGDHRREAEKMRQRALDRIANRTQDAEKKRTLEHLRAAVVCVLGHVDTGKTKILDKLRRTNVQDGEAGGITQQIGATNVPAENIKEQTRFVKGFQELEFKLPGLLIIDTPGHESFSNLRSRGSSLCDIAILVVDIMHGLEPQTIESINLLKSKRTPFVVALNKIDRLYDWSTMPRKDVRDILKAQASNTQLEFNQRTKEIIVQFAEQGLNAALFYENPDPKTYVSLVPTSAITGEGMGNLLFLIVQFCQKQLAKRLMYSEDLQATVLEVKAIPGLGTTIDAILINGKLREGDTMILAGTEGPIVTQIKALLMPQPMKELRVKNAYVEHKEILAAQGVKIAAKELEKAIAGLNLQIAHKPDEVEIFRDIVARDLKSALNSIKLSDRGVYVQASTLGSLEALLEFLRTSKIPVSTNLFQLLLRISIQQTAVLETREAERIRDYKSNQPYVFPVSVWYCTPDHIHLGAICFGDALHVQSSL